MRILVVQETDWIERNPILHHRMLESLALAGDDVLVLDYEIHWRRKGRSPIVQPRRVFESVTKFHAGSGVRVIRPAMLRIPVLARPSWLAMTAIELIRAYREFRPDVVLAYGLSNALVARVLASVYRVPFAFHIFDSLHALADPAWLASIARLVETALLRSSRIVILAHRGMQSYLAGMGVPRGRIRLILNGFERREPEPGDVAATRARLGVAQDVVLMVFVGWLYDHSGLLQIAQQLVATDDYPGFRLVVAGDGDLLPQLRALAADRERGDRLIVLGKVPVSEIPSLIGASDVGLFAALPSEAMERVVPAKVDEYLELGLPVVATRLPGMVRELGEVPAMIWVDGPERALAALAVATQGSPDRRAWLRALGSTSDAYAKGRESWATVTSRFRAALDEARERRTAA
ncbi:MAG: glycosyltransferase [Chloroflexota bacterium]